MLDQLTNKLLQELVIRQFSDLRYEALDASTEQAGHCQVTGRVRISEVVLPQRLQGALQALNPHVAPDLIARAIEEISKDRSVFSDIRANQDIYKLLKDGIRLPVSAGSGGHELAVPAEGVDAGKQPGRDPETVTVQFINWKEPGKNDFLLVTNLLVEGRLGPRRIDFVGFVNGLPLLLPIMRVSGLQDIYDTLVSEYKQQLPRLFWYNAFILLSNGTQSKLGSMTAPWEFFFEWKRVKDELDEENTTVETLLEGTCEQERLLDIIENFTLFSTEKSETAKIVARNHQYHGVNAAYKRLQDAQKSGDRKLGVFWHTQGAGKSYSMVFFAQKVLRKIGSWTFVVITDRDDLDKQIYNTFSWVGAISEPEEAVRASGREDLKQKLRENHRVLFTLIQKFSTEKAGQQYKEISDRSDIIIMADEAHRTQYDQLAENMRVALKNASFLAFTGTPLITGEEQETLDTFGPYISIYNFTQAIKDKTTVPLICDNHTPAIDLENPEFREAIKRLITDAALDEEQERKLSEQVLRENSIIASSSHLDYVAHDIVEHFMGRGYMGKAMVISIDKLTAVRTYNRVQREWQFAIAELEQQLSEETDARRRTELAETIEYMRETEMAVVISESNDDVERAEKLAEKLKEPIDIKFHHQIMREGKLEGKFKNAHDHLRIVFVCGMWMTGFDVPCLSTIYLDRPLYGHNLMQTLARANRVYTAEKTNGLIIDYVGTYNDLKDALAIYATGTDRRTRDLPIGGKQDLIEALKKALEEIETFSRQQGLDIPILQRSLSDAQNKQQQEDALADAVDTLLRSDDSKLHYLALAGNVERLYKAILPDADAHTYRPRAHLFRQIALAIYKAITCDSIADIINDARKLIDEALITSETVIREAPDQPYKAAGSFNLAEVDFDALAQEMEKGHRNLKAEQLRNLLTKKLQDMMKVNKSRVDYQEKLQNIVDKYNDTSANYADYPRELVNLARELEEEEQRHIKEQLSEEELAIFDLLTRPDLNLSEGDKQVVKQVTRSLLNRLKSEQFGAVEWQNNPKTRGQVRDTINLLLDGLPEVYEATLYRYKCDEVFHHVQTQYGQVS